MGSRPKRQSSFPLPKEFLEAPQVLVEFKDITCFVPDRADPILQSICGNLYSGEVAALLGPSGAGKTTLLHIIAGREITGLVSGVCKYHLTGELGFVAQEDKVEPFLTTREALMMYAVLKLPRNTTSRERQERVKELLMDLGLQDCQKSLVGGDVLQGAAKTLSGGEKRRLSIGCTIISNPMMIFLDEPTTGLDSGMALEVMAVLTVLKLKGCGMVCSIHQPRYDIFKEFEQCFFLAAGILVTAGERVHIYDFALNTLFAGTTLREDDLADVMLDHLSHMDQFTAKSINEKWASHEGFAAAAKKRAAWKEAIDVPTIESKRPMLYSRLWFMIKHLIKIRLIRGKGFLLAFTFGVVFNFLMGLVWSKQSQDSTALYGSVVTVCFLALFRGIGYCAGIVTRRTQYLHDWSIGLYGAPEYMIGELVTELLEVCTERITLWFPWAYITGLRTGPLFLIYCFQVLIGASVASSALVMVLAWSISNVTTATAMVSAIVTFLTAFSGIYCNTKELLPFVKWIYPINPFFYTVSGVIRAQFKNTEYGESTDLESFFEYTLEEDATNVWTISFVYLILAAIALSYRAWTIDWVSVYNRSPLYALINNMTYSESVSRKKALADAEKKKIAKKEEKASLTGNTAQKSYAGTETEMKVIRVEGPPIIWENINYIVTINNEQQGEEADDEEYESEGTELKSTVEAADSNVPITKQVLHNASGCVNPGTLCALMGPSGAGKTSLLFLLGNKTSGGEITGTLPNLVWDHCGFVWQEDTLEPACTVLETLRFYADLKLPANTEDNERAESVDRVLKELGLELQAHSQVGGASALAVSKTLSGGQRRRVSIGCALISNPSAVMLDEPTSGLDAGMAMEVMETLNRLTKSGRTCIASIHQPRIDIFREFDQVIFLAKGYTIYRGSPEVSNMISSGYAKVFEGRNPNLNPADLMLDMLSGMDSEEAKALGAAYDGYLKANPITNENREFPEGYGVARAEGEKRPGFLFRWQVIMTREVKVKILSVHTLVRVGSSVVWGSVFAIPFLNLDKTLSDSQTFDRVRMLFCLSQFQCVFTGQAGPSHDHYINQSRAEMRLSLYQPLESYLSYLITDSFLVILPGSMFMTYVMWLMANNTMEPGSVLYAVFICSFEHMAMSTWLLFLTAAIDAKKPFEICRMLTYTMLGPLSGFLITLPDISWSIRWLAYINPCKYAFAGIMQAEFSGKAIVCDNDTDTDSDTDSCNQGDDVLDDYAINDDSNMASNFWAVISLNIIFAILCYYFIARKFQ